MIEVAQPTGKFLADKLQAVVLDWAGTTVDFGSRAPVMAVLAAFEQVGVSVTEEEARRPMGRAKRDHLQAMLDDPGLARRWNERHGRAPTSNDLDDIYTTFLSAQADIVAEYSPLIPGCLEAIEVCRSLGIKIGSTTGYTRDLLARVAKRAEREGYRPEVMLSADDVAPGRPAPWLCLEAAKRLGVYPMSAVVKVDDTVAGVAAGRNAGAWSVGVVASGNEVGLSETAFSALPLAEKTAILAAANRRLEDAGAHFLIDTIAELPAAIAAINRKLANSISP